MNSKIIKLLIAIISIIFFTIISFIALYYYNIFLSKKSWNEIWNLQLKEKKVEAKKIDNLNNKIDENKKNTTQNLENTKIEKENNKKDLWKKVKEVLKEVNKEQKKETNEKKILNKSVLKKLFYLSEDNKKLYFIIKFLNRSFLVFKDGKEIIYIDLKSANANINIRKEYKEKINYIYDKKDLIDEKIINSILKSVNNTKQKQKINNEEININLLWKVPVSLVSFLTWFLSLSDYYKLHWWDIVTNYWIRVWYRYPLYGNMKLSFNINRIVFINDFYKPGNLFINLQNEINNNYNNVVFINFTLKEIDYLINFFFKKITINKKENLYNIYKVDINNYQDLLAYLAVKKILFLKNNLYNKTYKDIIRELNKNKLIYNLMIAYYKQLKFKVINPVIIKQIFFIGNQLETIPIQKKDKIKDIMDKISDLLIIDNINLTKQQSKK